MLLAPSDKLLPTVRVRTALALLAGCLAVCGCVQRRINVQSNPPGAQVYIDNFEIGTTPCSTSFTYYGTREIRLVKDGYETLVIKQPFPAPWYQYLPLDFVTENLLPNEIRDERFVTYNLAPLRMEPSEQLLGRAEQLRRSHQSTSLALPASATTPAPGNAAPLTRPIQPPPVIDTLPPPMGSPSAPQRPMWPSDSIH